MYSIIAHMQASKNFAPLFGEYSKQKIMGFFSLLLFYSFIPKDCTYYAQQFTTLFTDKLNNIQVETSATLLYKKNYNSGQIMCYIVT